MKCLNQVPCSSQALIKLRCTVMSGQKKKSIFFFNTKERHEFPHFSVKSGL